jgi:hypothetical protein
MPDKEIDKTMSLFMVIVFFIMILLLEKTNVLQQIKEDIKSPSIWIMFFITMAIFMWALNQKSKALKNSAHHAIVALIASYFSHLSMIFPAFYIVMIVEYFSRRFIG